MGKGLSGGKDKVVSRVTGVPASIRRLKQYAKYTAQGAEQGVKDAMAYLLEETLEVTPEDEGDLKESGGVSISGRGFNTKGTVFFGGTGPAAAYAIYVHEDLTKKHAPGTYAKFLQRTAWEKRKNISYIIADRANKRLLKARRAK